MIEIITYIFEFILMVLSFIASFLVIRIKSKSKVPQSNLFLSISSIFVGLYALSTIIYSLIRQEWAIIAFLKIGMISIVLAVFCLFLTIQILISSSKWISIHRFYFITLLAATTILTLLLIFTDFIKVIDIKTSETHFNPIIYYPFAIYIAFILVFSTFSTYYYGIRKSTGESRKRMLLFFFGLLIMLGGLIVDTIGNTIEIEIIFDFLLFCFLSIGISFVTASFLI